MELTEPMNLNMQELLLFGLVRLDAVRVCLPIAVAIESEPETAPAIV
jgi:hypothetical protein